MATIKEILDGVNNLEINKHTDKLIRAKGEVSQELLDTLLEATAELGIVDGKLDIETSQLFLFYGKPQPQPEPEVIKEPEPDSNGTVGVNIDNTISTEIPIPEPLLAPKPELELASDSPETEEEIPEEVKDIAKELSE